jgi:hypothetical protein
MNALNRNRWIVAGLVAAFSTMTVACVPDDGSESGPVSVESGTWEQALVSADDVALEYGEDGQVAQALNGTPSEIAQLTSDAVGGTNAFMTEHFQMLEEIAALPPTSATADTRLWQGEHEGLFLRLYAEKSATPRGTRFEYVFSGRPAADANADMLPILTGDVVRIETRPDSWGKQGFGHVRFNFRNLGILHPNSGIDGMIRVAFRRVGDVRQVHSRMIGVVTPDDPDFPEAAEYRYTQLPEGGGELRFFGKGDIEGDGAPFESLAVASKWRRNRSGIGNMVAFGGSLDVDYWHLTQCWDTALITGFERRAIPNYEETEGSVDVCFDLPDIETPEFQESLPDEDPAIPAAHPAE